MSHFNVEIKARASEFDSIKKVLYSRMADFIGTDNQTDTYFNVPNGRLKLREGSIENALIYYQRPNSPEAKQSDVVLCNFEKKMPELKELLEQMFGIKIIVQKQREIYTIANIKFYLDRIDGLGSFIEIEAISREGKIPREKLEEQVNNYMEKFGIKTEELIAESYSDLLLKLKQ